MWVPRERKVLLSPALPPPSTQSPAEAQEAEQSGDKGMLGGGGVCVNVEHWDSRTWECSGYMWWPEGVRATAVAQPAVPETKGQLCGQTAE